MFINALQPIPPAPVPVDDMPSFADSIAGWLYGGSVLVGVLGIASFVLLCWIAVSLHGIKKRLNNPK